MAVGQVCARHLPDIAPADLLRGRQRQLGYERNVSGHLEVCQMRHAMIENILLGDVFIVDNKGENLVAANLVRYRADGATVDIRMPQK